MFLCNCCQPSEYIPTLETTVLLSVIPFSLSFISNLSAWTAQSHFFEFYISKTLPLSLGQAQTCLPDLPTLSIRSAWFLLYFLITTIHFYILKGSSLELSTHPSRVKGRKQTFLWRNRSKPFQIKYFSEFSPLHQLYLPQISSEYLAIISQPNEK